MVEFWNAVESPFNDSGNLSLNPDSSYHMERVKSLQAALSNLLNPDFTVGCENLSYFSSHSCCPTRPEDLRICLVMMKTNSQKNKKLFGSKKYMRIQHCWGSTFGVNPLAWGGGTPLPTQKWHSWDADTLVAPQIFQSLWGRSAKCWNFDRKIPIVSNTS